MRPCVTDGDDGGGAGAHEQAERGSVDQRCEAFFTVGEYDIVIPSAQESDAWTWLTQNGYNIPRGYASAAPRPYVRQGMKFLRRQGQLRAEQAKGGSRYLSPLQFGFASEKFMLPMRLGMLNAKGPQDLIV